MTADFAASSGAPLIGRDRELAELHDRLQSNRLVTVIGPGGVGKTALARRAADVASTQFPLGVRHVDLTRVAAADAVPGALAGQLGFESFDALLSSPADREALVVVDNCEHLLDAAAATILQILDSCRLPSIIATSRSPLELPGESVLALAPLTVPSDVDDDPATSPAMQLFLDRARNAGASFGDGDRNAVVELCRRLDGLPLAIEIAAARARTMSVAEIAARLGEGVDVLERPRFRGPSRHRSIADTIGWSYALLPPPAADLLDRLAVFAGPFTTADARRVAGSAAGDDQFGQLLDELVNLSLVVAETSGSETMYRLLDTIRRFALDRLDRTDRRVEAFDRFADHAVTLAHDAFVMGTTSWDGLLRHLVASFDTLTEALRWCLDHDREPDRAMTLCAVLWPVGRYPDTVGLARRVFERWPNTRNPIAADATVTLAYGECTTGNPQVAAQLAEAQLAHWTGRALASVTLRRALGHTRIVMGDMAGAITAFRDGSEIARQLGFVEAALDLSVSEGEVEAHLGNVDAALALLGHVRREAAAARSGLNEATAATSEAWVLVNRDGTAALPAVQHALGLARAIEHRGAISANLRSLVHIHLQCDDLPAATATLREWFESVVVWGGTSDARNIVGAAAVVAHRAGHASWAALAATHRQMPVQLLPSDVGAPLFALPDVDVAPVPPRERLAAVKVSLAGVEELLRVRGSNPDATSDDAEDDVAEHPSMRALGDVWEVHFDGRSVTVRASKGHDDVARLVEAAGREIHCLDLMGAVVEESSTGEVIDSSARRRYEERIRELQQAVDEAEADNDYVRAERAQAEFDTLVEHLAAAVGRGGKTRRAGASAERARSAVTQRVRAAIRQLDGLHPALGRHLHASIRTGLYCSYQPERPTIWEITR